MNQTQPSGEHSGQATQRVKINVEQRHIERGVAASARGCPVALAVADALPLSTVNVTHYWLSMRPLLGGEKFKCDLPNNASDFIRTFDAVSHSRQFGKWIPFRTQRPFSFELDVPLSLLPKEPVRPQGVGACASQASTVSLQSKDSGFAGNTDHTRETHAPGTGRVLGRTQI